MATVRHWGAILAPLVLAACVTSDDPRAGGFIGGISGLSSGAYDRRVQDRQDATSALQAENEALERRAKEVQGRRVAATQDREAAARLLTTLQGDLTSLKQKLAAAKKSGSASSATLDKLRNDLTTLELENRDVGAKSATMGEAATSQRIKEIDEKKRQLEMTLDDAMMLSTGTKR
jgi:chromosome segregation ATPase